MKAFSLSICSRDIEQPPEIPKPTNNVVIVEGDLLKAPEQYIVHQCNCVTINAKGIALSINKKYPWANIYSERKTLVVNGTRRNLATVNTRDIPGTIKIQSSPMGSKHVICMFSQYYPGKPNMQTSYNKNTLDTVHDRSKWFTKCLDKIAEELPDVKTLAFPYKIGCGLAGGDWYLYYRHLRNFSMLYKKKVIIYKLKN